MTPVDEHDDAEAYSLEQSLEEGAREVSYSTLYDREGSCIGRESEEFSIDEVADATESECDREDRDEWISNIEDGISSSP